MASTSGAHMSSLQNPISKRNNYEYFSLTMESFFRGQNVWEIVQNGYTEWAHETSYNNLKKAEKDFLME